ncbi:MAG: primosomal protein N' [Planctomycetia bacterium]|nr:primosomal protein N' [Planctomycetia bacterium]
MPVPLSRRCAAGKLDAEEALVAKVLLPTGPAEPLDYRVPDRLRGNLQVGCRVTVPLGRGDRPRVGYCVGLESGPVARRLKEVHGLVDEQCLLSPPMFRLSQWIAEHYLCTWSQALDAILPAAVRQHAGTRRATMVSLVDGVADRIDTVKLPAKQMQVLRYLAAGTRPVALAELMTAVPCTHAPIAALRRKGLVQAATARVRQEHYAKPAPDREANHALNEDQERALETIRAALESRRQQSIVLHGITGSGKTEVYIRAIQEMIAYGRQAIVLVPEISLTPQAEERFRARFGQVAVLHSHMTDAERGWQWERIAREEVSVVVGARSAIFAPVPRLGLIVVDEEHEGSFKQDSAPRYHARDVALERARAEEVPLVLGSATPSLESWHRAQSGVYQLVEMPRRVLDRPLPDVRTIDLRNQFERGAFAGALSRPLRLAMQDALGQGGQVILLLNRRGYATHLQCPSCGAVVRCPHCDIALTHHRQKAIALCHYCDYEIPAPHACPECDVPGIRYSGLGTEKLEAEVRTRFPEARSLRMDTDTMQATGSHERALAAFRSGEVRILLGTQMIAKGLDFPDVTLVGVVNADTALHLPDFRAAERTFQLLVQVAGRTGRGPRGGRVLVQTFSPDHPAIQAAVRHDYRAFADRELPLRRLLGYPPYAEMIRIVVRGERENTTFEFARSLADCCAAELKRSTGATRILGPAPAPIGKLRGQYRFQVQLQGPDASVLRAAVRHAQTALKPPDDVQWTADVDPLDML